MNNTQALALAIGLVDERRAAVAAIIEHNPNRIVKFGATLADVNEALATLRRLALRVRDDETWGQQGRLTGVTERRTSAPYATEARRHTERMPGAE